MKVRFELNIDEIIEGEVWVSNDHEVFKKAESTGKTFLFVDKLTGTMQAAYCKEAASEDSKYARVDFFPLSSNAVVIDEERKENDAHEALMSHIQDCCDKVCKTAQFHDEENASRYNLVMEGIKGIFDKIEEGGSGNGISEKTLLNALEIVTKNNNK